MSTSHKLENVSPDLVWEVTRKTNAYLVKRSDAGGVQFSRDPMNITNKNSRKHAGFLNNKAIGVQSDDKGNVHLASKHKDSHSSPALNRRESKFKSQRSNRNIYKSIVGATTNEEYRPDLKEAAVARASALRRASRPRKARAAPKPRGSKSKKVEA